MDWEVSHSKDKYIHSSQKAGDSGMHESHMIKLASILTPLRKKVDTHAFLFLILEEPSYLMHLSMN